jgi:hypothetical protein
MTCEVMLMNLEAVAFAADSAVTLQETDARGNVRMRQARGVDKAFILDARGPVGAIIYGNAEYGGCPWSTLMRSYAESLTASPATVADVGGSLFNFLLHTGEHDPSLVRPQAREHAFTAYVMCAVSHYLAIVKTLEAFKDQLKGDDPDRVTDSALVILEHEITHEPEDQRATNTEATLRKRPVIGAPAPRLLELTRDLLGPLVDHALTEGFARKPPPGLAARLKTVIEGSLLNNWLPPMVHNLGFITGLVLAGFGQKDRTPSFLHLHVFGDIGGVLKHQVVEAGRTSQGKDAYIARSFALNSAVTAFTEGVHPRARGLLMHFISRVMEESFQRIYQKVHAQNSALAADLAGDMSVFLQEGPKVAVDWAAAEHTRIVQADMGRLAAIETDEMLADRARRLLQLVVLEHELADTAAVASPVSLLRMRKGHADLRKS